MLSALADAGMTVAEEAGRAVIREELAKGSSALPWADRMAFAERMFERDIASHERFSGADSPVFFDRGIPDVLGYLNLCGLAVPSYMRAEAETRRYNRVVFIAPHWPAIYTQDTERKQDEGEAARTFAVMDVIYTELGYELCPLPKAGVGERVAFVLDTVSAASR